jgi:hypothetical protein
MMYVVENLWAKIDKLDGLHNLNQLAQAAPVPNNFAISILG